MSITQTLWVSEMTIVPALDDSLKKFPRRITRKDELHLSKTIALNVITGKGSIIARSELFTTQIQSLMF